MSDSKKTVLIIQARMSSSRLPGKVMADIAGRTMLQRVFDRCRQAKRVDHVLLATSNDEGDDILGRYAMENGIPVFRGDLDDVLDRFFHAAMTSVPAKIVRVTADCPLVDPFLIDQVVDKFEEGDWDYVSNFISPTFPDGVDVEVFSMKALERAWKEAARVSDREHVTPWMKRDTSDLRLAQIEAPADYSKLRWTVDTQSDLDYVRRIYDVLDKPDFGWMDVVKLEESGRLERGVDQVRNEGLHKSVELDQRQAGRGQRLYERAKQVIPGGTQLLSKRPEMFLPGQWPAYFSRVKGCEVWTLDGDRFIDFSHNGIGTCVLGAGDPDVDAAVLDAVRAGTMSTLNCPEEVELAELLCELHPWASMARFCRTGGEAMAMAVRLARAGTGRDKIAFCGYHGWHDWYLSANLSENGALDGHLMPGLSPKGVPRGLLRSALAFRYNHLEELERIVTDHGEDLAAIVMEPIRGEQPADGFLQRVRELATKSGARLVFDECSSGFRVACGGAHLGLDVVPDIAMFAKAMSNGFPMAAVIGTGDAMGVAEETFMSSTYWTERIGPVAALACLKKFRRERVHECLIEKGARVQEGWATAASKASLTISVGGIEPLSHFAIEHPEGGAARTYFTQRMLEFGFLASGAFYPTLAHTEEGIDSYLSAVEQIFCEIAEALDAGNIASFLKGAVAHQGFRRLVS